MSYDRPERKYFFTTFPAYVCKSDLLLKDLKKKIEDVFGLNSVSYIRAQIKEYNKNIPLSFLLIKGVTDEGCKVLSDDNIIINRLKIDENKYPIVGREKNDIVVFFHKFTDSNMKDKEICVPIIEEYVTRIITALEIPVPENFFKITVPIKDRTTGDIKPICIVEFAKNTDIELISVVRILLDCSNWDVENVNTIPIKCSWSKDFESIKRSFIYDERNNFQGRGRGGFRGRGFQNRDSSERDNYQAGGRGGFRGRGFQNRDPVERGEQRRSIRDKIKDESGSDEDESKQYSRKQSEKKQSESSGWKEVPNKRPTTDHPREDYQGRGNSRGRGGYQSREGFRGRGRGGFQGRGRGNSNDIKLDE